MGKFISFWLCAKSHSLRFIKEDKAASGIEYVLIAVMVAVVLTAFSGPIATAVTSIMTSIQTALS
ncbi:Flp family type IVb pilin [Zobellella endophytica]|uniref:Flp family type IVb pilin n=1 Tax=Zobellella endophytica TaxID=2116700 RepID=A0A2P7RD55_9GAMM|nr:Flp family type IVb pilin [Zobellella endophytica]PSJ48141.1 Flp family type IVb pilin [Zobellella endophytica]